jgi:prepilin-type N-terminal cleavage/methylation domain-containing protein
VPFLLVGAVQSLLRDRLLVKDPVFQSNNQHGFTFIEIAIVMVIIGLLAGGGVSLIGMLTKKKARNEAIDYLKEVKQGLVSYANIHGKIPWADTDGDGNGNNGAASGTLPYLDFEVRPSDPYKRVLKYEINNNLGTDRPTSCSTLKTGLSSGPRIVDADGTASSFYVAAIIISPGPMDADSDGDVFDAVTSGPHQGDNTDGTPNYLRHPPTDTFDDLVIYIGGNELYGNLCEYLTLAVNNGPGEPTAYVRDINQGIDLGSISGGGSAVYEIISGTRIEIRSAAGGGGAIIASTPPTPISLSGNGFTITIP